jgi:hypothetical protein
MDALDEIDSEIARLRTVVAGEPNGARIVRNQITAALAARQDILDAQRQDDAERRRHEHDDAMRDRERHDVWRTV